MNIHTEKTLHKKDHKTISWPIADTIPKTWEYQFFYIKERHYSNLFHARLILNTSFENGFRSQIRKIPKKFLAFFFFFFFAVIATYSV